MSLTMINVDFSQLKPISGLPRNYAFYIEETMEKGTIILMKKNRPKAALVDFKKWEEMAKKLDEAEAILDVMQSEKEYCQGKSKVLTSLADL